MIRLLLVLLGLVATSTLGIGGHDEPGGTLAAVLVATSTGPDARRHQADVLAQYVVLRANGVDDADIHLLVAGDLPATVRHDVRGQNLAADAVVDGDVGALADVLDGIGTDRLYVFVAGHGNRDGLRLGASRLSPEGLGAMLPTGTRTLLVVEACDSGVFTAIADDDVAVLTAAGADEASVGTNLDRATGRWLADELSFALAELAGDDADVSLAAARAALDREVRSSTPQLAGGDASWRLADFVAP